ncbi:MAG: ethanolamine utilization protein EutN [Calditrichaeota bacterium]|nr:MAG: ethanolamine utilization protein EutN [Calditrichota bacterium]
MRYGEVIGKIWATQKDKQLGGLKLYVIQPLDESQKSIGRPLIAVDTINASDGDRVFWVTGGEATLAFKNRRIPSDATIVGFVDRLDV